MIDVRGVTAFIIAKQLYLHSVEKERKHFLTHLKKELFEVTCELQLGGQSSSFLDVYQINKKKRTS